MDSRFRKGIKFSLVQTVYRMHPINFVPDLHTREITRDIFDKDITQMVFHGSSFQNGEEPIHVKDQLLIGKFMAALHEAEGRGAELGNRIDVLKIYRRRKVGVPRLPVVLRFYAYNPFDCFGPAFQECLKDLSDYHAARESQRARNIIGKVAELELFAAHIANSEFIDDTELAQALVTDLAHLDRKAFVFTNHFSKSCLINVKLNDGTLTDFSLAVTTQPTDMPPLPPLLMEHYSYLVAQLPNFIK